MRFKWFNFESENDMRFKWFNFESELERYDIQMVQFWVQERCEIFESENIMRFKWLNFELENIMRFKWFNFESENIMRFKWFNFESENVMRFKWFNFESENIMRFKWFNFESENIMRFKKFYDGNPYSHIFLLYIHLAIYIYIITWAFNSTNSWLTSIRVWMKLITCFHHLNMTLKLLTLLM